MDSPFQLLPSRLVSLFFVVYLRDFVHSAQIQDLLFAGYARNQMALGHPVSAICVISVNTKRIELYCTCLERLSHLVGYGGLGLAAAQSVEGPTESNNQGSHCLLYTSDAADE